MIPISLSSESCTVLIHDNYISFVLTKWRIQFQLLFCYVVGIASEKMGYHSFQSFPWWCYWEHFFKCIFAVTYFLSAASPRWQNEMVKLPANFLNICKLQCKLHCPGYLIINSSTLFLPYGSAIVLCITLLVEPTNHRLYLKPMCSLASSINDYNEKNQKWKLTKS